MQTALAPRQQSLAGHCVPARPCKQHFSLPRLVVKAEGQGGRPIREYREDTGEVVVPGGEAQQQKADGALYADQVAPQMAKKQQDNMSREMKQRLRQEYYGLGGAENKAMNSNYFLWIIVVISVLAVLSKLTGAI